MENKLLQFANTKIGRQYFGVPEEKEVIRITDGSVHYYTGELSKNPKGYGLPVICASASPGGADVKRVKWLLKLCPGIIELALLGIKHPAVWLMADTGYKAPTATGGKYNEWTNPTYAYADDASYATFVDNATSSKQSYETFGFGVPAGATINGIEYTSKGKCSGGNYGLGQRVYSTSDGLWSNSLSHSLPIIEDTVTRGSPTDLSLWGRNWIVSDFSDANFSAYISSGSAETGWTLSVNYIQVKVYYTAAGPANLKTINGLAKASVKTVNGLAIASIKTWNGLA